MAQRILVVDDEPPARARLRGLLGELTDCDVVGEAGSGDEAVRLCMELKPDVVLLDVRMPGIGGLEAARHLALLDAPPAVIFTTAYDAYAVEAFESEAVGYLLKPIRAEKLAAALERAARAGLAPLARLAAAAPKPEARTHVAVRVREGIKLVPLSEVFHFTADQKYTTMRHANGSDLIEDSLKSLEEEFADRFVRIHRNALVALASIAALERGAESVYQAVLRETGEKLPVSRRLASELKERLGL